MTGFMSAPRWKQQLVSFIAILGALGNERVAAARTENGYAPVRRSLGTDAAYQHLENETNYGIYTVVGSSTRVLAFDLDDHDDDLALSDVIAKANEIAEALRVHGLFPMLFVSGGGAGVHVWVAFERKQNAAIVRRFGAHVAGSVGLTVGTKGLVASEVEVYPKQDRVEGDKLGSLIALPLGRNSRGIDPSTLRPVPLEEYDPPSSLQLFSGDIPDIAVQNEKAGATNRNKRRRVDRTAEEELETLAEALRHVDASDFEQWVKVGLAIKHEFAEAGFDVWHRWSQSAGDKYVDEADCRQRWDSLKPDGRISLGTVYHLAKTGGWNGTRPYIAEMNRRYGILPFGQKTLIILKQPDERSLSVFETLGVRQLYDRHKPDRVLKEMADGQVVPQPVAEAWFQSPEASRYTRVDYDPDSPPGDNGTWWNLWRGFAVEPIPGRWDRFQDHLACNIADGDEDIFDWLLNWMAYGVQNPGSVIGTTPVLRGLPGTGKGTLAHGYGSLFGRHYITVTQSEHVAGRFNGHFFARRFIFIDEGTFGGSRREAGVLKTRITEDVVVLEQKGIDAIMVRNRAMFMVASNSYSVVPADMGDRRWMVLDVGDGRIQDHDYFGAIRAELDAGGREAMLYDLLKRDISKGPNPRQILYTEARITQILVSEAPYIRMLHSLLDEGRLPQNWLTLPNATTIRALLNELQKRYGDRHMSDISLGRLFREIIPGLRSRVNGHYVVGFSNGEAIKERSTEYIFPPLPEARKAFERRIGSPLNWSNDLADWEPEPMNSDQLASRDGDDLP